MEYGKWQTKKNKLIKSIGEELSDYEINNSDDLSSTIENYSIIIYSKKDSDYIIEVAFRNINRIVDNVKIKIKKKKVIFDDFYQNIIINETTFNIEQNEEVIKEIRKIQIKIKLLDVFIKEPQNKL